MNSTTEHMDNSQDSALAAIILASISTSLTLVIILYWTCQQIRARRAARRKQEVPIDIKRSVAEHEHLINRMNVKLRDAIREMNEKIVDKGTSVDIEEVLRKSETIERLVNERLSDNSLPNQPEVKSDIETLGKRIVALETSTDNILQELRRIGGGSDPNMKTKPPLVESPAAKGLQSYQNNRMFEEIMAYRGKIVSLQKKDAETRKQLKSLQQKLARVMAELNMADDNSMEEGLSETLTASNLSLTGFAVSPKTPEPQTDTSRKSKHFSWARSIQAETSPAVKSSPPVFAPAPIIKRPDKPASPEPVDVSMDTEMNTYLNARLTDLTGTGNLSGRGSEEDYFRKTPSSDSLARNYSNAYDVGSDIHLSRTLSKSRDFDSGSDADYGLEILKGSDVDKGVKMSKTLIADVGSDSHEGRVIISRNNSYDSSSVDICSRFGSGVDCSENNARIMTSDVPTNMGIRGRDIRTAEVATFLIAGEQVVEESDPLLDSEC